MDSNTRYTCHIYTNKYSGSFIRELTAYITGHYNDWGGDEYAEMARMEILDEEVWAGS
jgi:hypothetical protein